MLIINKAVKGIISLVVHLQTAVKCYALSLLFTSPLFIATMSIISGVLGKLPQAVNDKFIIVYLCSCSPLFIVFSAIVEANYFKTYAKDR